MAVKINYSKNGNDYFRVTTSVGRDSNGKLIRKEFYGKSKKEAEAKKDDYLNGLKNGLSIDYKTIVLGKLMHSWLFEILRVSSHIKPSTFQRYEGIFRNYIENSNLYGIKLNDIKSIQIQRYYNELYESGKTYSQIYNLNKLLKSLLNYAVEEGYILKNPCSNKRIVIPGQSKIKSTINNEYDEDNEVVIYSNDEIKLLKADLENHRLKAAILLDLGTGLRLGELLALQWSDIDSDYSELKVQRTIKEVTVIAADRSKQYKTLIQPPKTKKSIRTVPIPSSLVDVLKEHRQRQEKEKSDAGTSYIESDFVFTTELGKNIDSNNFRRSYKRILTKAGIEYKKFHALRHTYATKLFEREVPLKTVSELLGHSDISITANIYTHVMPEVKITAAEKLNHLFE
jgi:integrase